MLKTMKRAKERLEKMIKGEAEFDGLNIDKDTRIKVATELCDELRWELVKKLADGRLGYSDTNWVYTKIWGKLADHRKDY